MWKFCSFLLIKKDQTPSSFICLCWTGVLKQKIINLYKSCSTTKKSLNFLELTPSNTTNEENMPLDVNQEIITPRVPQFSTELNVENLCGKQTTQLKVLIVNPNGRIDSHCSFDDETLFPTRLLLLLMNKYLLLSIHVNNI